MCASYGLDPRFADKCDLFADDRELLDALLAWAEENAGATLLPTGKNARNRNPIIVDEDGDRRLVPGWWGFLAEGGPVRFSINTRSERLERQRVPLRGRAIVPATSWFELQKPQRRWHEFRTGGLFAIGAVTRPGHSSDGEEHTCYSIVMQDSPEGLAGVHDRSPVLIPADFVTEWLTSPEPARDLVAEAVSRSAELLDQVWAEPISSRP